jgi:sulfide:quinone oxidoreductase
MTPDPDHGELPIRWRGGAATVCVMTGPEHILVAGGGVAAVEAVVALRALAGPRPRITLLTPEAAMEHRPASVATPFGFGGPAPLPLAEVRARAHFELEIGRLASVDAAQRRVADDRGRPVAFDALVVAVGARTRPALAGALTFAGAQDALAVADVLDAAARSGRPRLAFTLPATSTWALPVYEMAMLAAVELRNRGVVDAELTVVTPEPRPLWTFGPEAGDVIERLLAERGVALRTGALPLAVRSGELEVSAGPPVPADHVIALPRLEGPAIPGLPRDDSGFIPVDAYGRVSGTEDIYAAGDATAFPLKQGGLATQQADTVAEVLAAACGAPVSPKPFRPILRGLLLTGGAPLYLRSTLDLSGSPLPGGVHARRLSAFRPSAEVSTRALWWPPGKIAGRYLAPLLATARPSVLASAPLVDRPLRGSAAAPAEGREDALALALLLADEDAAIGDFAQAVHALDAAAALTGGILPGEYVARRDEWLAAPDRPQPPK